MWQFNFSCDDYFYIVNMHHSCWINFRLKTLQSHSVCEAHITAAAAKHPAQRTLPDARSATNEQ